MYSYKQKPKNKSKKVGHKKRILASVVVLVLVAAGIYLLANRGSDKPADTSATDGKINYQPASPVEKKDSEDTKDQIVKDQETQTVPSGSTTAPDQKKAVKPVITNTNGSVNAYVTGVFEDGGSCTATFVKGSTTKTKTSEGFENASYTQCAPMSLESGFLSSGTWNLTVSYSSAKAAGSSDVQKVEVQ